MAVAVVAAAAAVAGRAIGRAVAEAARAVAKAATAMAVENLHENSKPFGKKVKAVRSASDALVRRRIEGGTPAP